MQEKENHVKYELTVVSGSTTLLHNAAGITEEKLDHTVYSYRQEWRKLG